MARNCKCSGGCGDINRRDFIKIAGLGAAGVLLPAGAQAQAPGLGTPTPAGLKQWQAGLMGKSVPRIYDSGVNTEARMHMGGIGTGNIELGVDGQFTTWNLFNTLEDGSVPLCFGLRAGGQARLLQTAGGPDVPHVPKITMRGEYPIVELAYEDPDLPVQVKLTAMTPLIPLDERASSMPAIHLQFEISNPTAADIPVSLAGFMLNPVGYEGGGSFDNVSHPAVGHNINQLSKAPGLTLLQMSARPAQVPSLEHPVTVYSNRSASDFVRNADDLPHGLQFEGLDRLPPAPDPARPAVPLGERAVIWIDQPDENLSSTVLDSALYAVQQGAALLISGASPALLSAYGTWSGGKDPLRSGAIAAPKPDILIDDFESGSYAGWTVEGDAFGKSPSRGTEANQQPVSGFQGKYLVNSFEAGDGPQGRMLSKPFTIRRNFIRLLVGGGSSPETAAHLLIGGRVVRSASGKNQEQLSQIYWDISEFQGQEGRIEIVDHATGAWGHINVDDIVMVDSPVHVQALQILAHLLPANFSGLVPDNRSLAMPIGVAGGVADDSTLYSAWLSARTRLTGLSLATDSNVAFEADGNPILLQRSVGRGRSFLLAAPLLPPDWLGRSSAPRLNALAFLASLGGVPAPVYHGILPTVPGAGTFALAAAGKDVSANLSAPTFADLWKEFSSTGRLADLPNKADSVESPPGRSTFGGLSLNVVVPAHGSVQATYVLAWHMPNFYAPSGQAVGNYYATLWKNADEVARELAADPHRVVDRTLAFRHAMYDSSLPYWLLDCLTSQLGTARHIGVVFRLSAGDIYGWEGSNGCCEPTCTHVWGYEQSLSRVFPSLERRMRFIDYMHQQDPDGGIHNRTDWPSPPHPTGERPFADGHASCVLKAYREALNTPDNRWLQEYWPNIRKAVDYLVARDAAGGEPDGILEDDQFNTYDDAVHGPNSFIGSYYLAALRAGEEMAIRMGDSTSARRYRAIFEKGQQKLVGLCWNGDYFQQNLPDYSQRSGEYGPGCLADQLIGQWWAHLLGLGYVLPQDHVRKALRTLFANNWLPDMSHFVHHQRWFAGGHDKGLLNCSWPRAGRPANPSPYVDEVWTGVEYEVAGLMIYEGMLTDALSIVKGARDRYDGIPRPPMGRNPWNELECGGHYTRAMSSWGLLLALSGFHYDGPERVLTFVPVLAPDQFRSFFTSPESWGSLRQDRKPGLQVNEIRVVEGRLPVSSIQLHVPPGLSRVKASIDGANVKAKLRAAGGQQTAATVEFEPSVVVSRLLRVELSKA